MRGLAPTGRFHIQVTCSNGRGRSDDLLFRMIPDLDLLRFHLANTDPQRDGDPVRCPPQHPWEVPQVSLTSMRLETMLGGSCVT